MSLPQDPELVRMILSGGKGLNKAVALMHQHLKSMVHQHITHNSGRAEDADDIFAESMVALVQNVLDGKFRGESSIRTYLKSIAHHKWLNRLRAKRPTVAFEDHMAELEDPAFADMEDLPSDERLAKLVDGLMQQIDPQCNKFFHLRYWCKQRMEQVAVNMGFKNAQIAKNKHQKCLKKLRELLDGNENLKDILGGMVA
jgi:RNA polymerase sigma factor (sigma-70 family)